MDDNCKVQKITVCTVQFQHLMTKFHVNRVSHKIMLGFLGKILMTDIYIYDIYNIYMMRPVSSICICTLDGQSMIALPLINCTSLCIFLIQI